MCEYCDYYNINRYQCVEQTYDNVGNCHFWALSTRHVHRPHSSPLTTRNLSFSLSFGKAFDPESRNFFAIINAYVYSLRQTRFRVASEILADSSSPSIPQRTTILPLTNDAGGRRARRCQRCRRLRRESPRCRHSLAVARRWAQYRAAAPV